ncbi:SMP-30 region [Venustampulla echinocandica]|uniref:SMP-30 region n=1 Tax=Venustampulla echinocandica TaxID=2656787 RepID=A0A370TCY2_9HELO|nr:SMP-30 region [Venustampulla echinocandica]RDL32081.1 SMP-30 region [Venustampulla echinocandica]
MANYKTWTVTEPYLNIHCSLGEGPYYEASRNVLRFVDIIQKRVHTVDLSIGPSSLTTLQLDMPVGVTADIEGVDSNKKILIGAKRGLYLLDRATGSYELLKRYHDTEENDERLRGNDGAVDPQGRFWIGTMNDFWVGPPNPEGCIFRFNNDLSRHTLRTSLVIPNSIGWSPDHKTLYFTDTTAARIIAFDYDDPTGDLSNERVFWQHDGDGGPDGFKVDEEGYIWQALYGGSRVLKISPEGKVVGEVKYPTRAITCPVFIGTELWVTTASENDENEVESMKYGGAIFKVDVGVKGLPEFKFRMEK